MVLATLAAFLGLALGCVCRLRGRSFNGCGRSGRSGGLLLIGPCIFGKANDALLDDVILVLLARRITEGVDDDDGDVVETTGDNRLLDQCVAGMGGSGIIEQDFLDVLIGDHGA